MSLIQGDISGAAAVLEHFTAIDPTHERNASRRVLVEVTQAWPGNTDRLWWKWFVEAASSLRLRAKAVDCSLDEARRLAKDHAQFVCYKPGNSKPADGEANRRGELDGSGSWLAVLATSRRGHQVLEASQVNGQATKKMSYRKLCSKLKSYASPDGRIRCVVIHPQEDAISRHFSKQPSGMKPLVRLLKLLKPEFRDVWTVLVFAFVVALLMLATPVAVEALVNTVAFGRFLQPIVVLAIILLTFLGFQGAIRGLQTFLVEIIQRRLFARIAADLANRLPRTEVDEADGEHVPELVNRFFDVVSVQKVTATLLLDGLGLVLSTVIGMAVLAFYHPWLLGFDVFLLASIAVIILLLGRGAVPSAIFESKHKYYMASWLEDLASCPVAFHGEGGAEFALERADRLIHQYLIARKDHFAIVMRQILFALGLQAVASTVLLGLGGWLVVAGELTLGQLVAAELIVTVIVGSFAKIGKHMESYYDLLASVDKLGTLFDMPTERRDGMLGLDQYQAATFQLHAVSYRYAGYSKDAVKSISTEVQPGERVALLGGAGSGKSTLLDLLYGFRSPTAGHLTIDDFDPRDLRPDILRSRVALARDEVFHATIEENIHLHREGVRSLDVREVLEQLGILNSILSMRDGCATMLTSHGKPLSETQRKMLAIARAAVGQPGLLLVDGLLDTMGSRELDMALSFLTDKTQPWTLVVATARQDIARRLDYTISINEMSAEAQFG